MTKDQLKRYLQNKIVYAGQRDDYIGKIPSDISAAFFDNTYVDLMHKEIALLEELLISNPLVVDLIQWYIYEVLEGNTPSLSDLGKNYIFKTLDDFVNYVGDSYAI